MPAREPAVVGVILAAGAGTRIRPLSDHLPKPILPVGNRPMLEYQLDMLREAGIHDVYIVVGRAGAKIMSALGDGSKQGLHLRYVEQGEALGIAHALGTLEPFIRSPFIVFLGDIFFVADSLGPAIAEVVSGKVQVNLISKVEPSPDMIRRNFVIIDDGAGRVRRVIEKPKEVPTNLKGCGIYVLDPHVFDAIRRTPRSPLRNEHEITDTMQILIDDGLVVRHTPIVREDINVTNPADLLAVNLFELERRGTSTILGRNLSLPSGTRIERSVVGDDVTLEHPIRISGSLVFAGSRITADQDLEGVIAFGTEVISGRAA